MDAFQVSSTPLQKPQLNVDIGKMDYSMDSRPRLRPEAVSLTLIHNWLNICRYNHGDKCMVYPEKRMFPIRLVDVRAGTLTPFAQSDKVPPYVALSWVWGSAKPSDGLTSDRLPHAAKGGFLNTLRLPTSVSDAVILLRRLGLRYLWVDILCIVQDNAEDKDRYIPLMGLVYTASEFTIIANGKRGSSDGLPGVRAATRSRVQQVVHYDKLTLVSGLRVKFVRGIDGSDGEPDTCERDLVEPDSPWQLRAWTFQEKLLSRRCLIFGTHQTHWDCLEASYCEESHFEGRQNGTFSVHWPLQSPFSRDLIRRPREEQPDFYSNFHEQYTTLVDLYTQRDITFSSDALNAFQGILDTMSRRTGIQFRWGLPCSLFEQHLLWDVAAGRKRYHDAFPSWSWLDYRCLHTDRIFPKLTVSAATRCYIRTDVSPNGDKNDLSIQAVTDENHYPEDYPRLDSTASKARNVEIDDIPVALRMIIQPLFHLIFWADTVRVRWQEHSQGSHFGLLHVPDRGSEPIGTATFERYYRNGRNGVECTMVRVLDPDRNHARRQDEEVLLVVETNGEAKRVGLAHSHYEHSHSIRWEQELIILG
ncbi:MAG: hypothetical protein Q9208_008551 [Pyrenodesmia sp. 3 TL-2023]